jgi:hypothetical protein
MKSNLGFSVSKFLAVIHHSVGTPAPRGAPSSITWGYDHEIAGLGSDTTRVHTNLLSYCIRWYSFIHSYVIQYCHIVSSTTPTSWGAIARLQGRSVVAQGPLSVSLVPSTCLRLLSSVTRVFNPSVRERPMAVWKASDRLCPDRPKPSPPAALQAGRPLSDLR